MTIPQSISSSRIKEHWERERVVFVHKKDNRLFVGGVPFEKWQETALQQEARIFKVVNRVTGEKFYLHKTLGEFERAPRFKAIKLKFAKENGAAFAIQRGKRIFYYVVQQGWFANKVVKATREDFEAAIAREDQPSFWQKATAVGMATMATFTGIVGGAILARSSVEHLPSLLPTAFSAQNVIIPFLESTSSFFKLPSSMLLASLMYQQTRSLPCFYSMLMCNAWLQTVRGQAAMTLDLATLTSSQGMVLLGAPEGGISVSSAGDVNGDGKADLLIGAPGAAPSGRTIGGTSYLIYGNSSLPGTLDLSNLTPRQGMVILGADAYDESGFSVSSAGDVNGDGKADLLIGAPYVSPSGRTHAGTTYLIYGSSSLPGTLDLASLTSSQGMLILGAVEGDASGWSVSSAGDVNNDGKADLLIGAYTASPSGRFQAGTNYLIYGNSSLPGTLDLASLTSSHGMVILGAASLDVSGYSVSSAGDVNGDGKIDLLIGAIGASPPSRLHAGTSYLLYGNRNLPSTLDLLNLTSSQGMVIFGATASDSSGYSVSSAGDVNGDGKADLLIGAYYASPSRRTAAGSSYLIYGNSSLPGTLDLASLTANQGIVIIGAADSDESGSAVSSAGDVNGDGKTDLLIGAPYVSPSGRGQAGTSYLLYGNSSLPVTLDLSSLTANQGMVIIGAEAGYNSGISVSSAGDVNGDGKVDLLIGALGTNYLLYGSTFQTSPPTQAPSGMPSLSPTTQTTQSPSPGPSLQPNLGPSSAQVPSATPHIVPTSTTMSKGLTSAIPHSGAIQTTVIAASVVGVLSFLGSIGTFVAGFLWHRRRNEKRARNLPIAPPSSPSEPAPQGDDSGAELRVRSDSRGHRRTRRIDNNVPAAIPAVSQKKYEDANWVKAEALPESGRSPENLRLSTHSSPRRKGGTEVQPMNEKHYGKLNIAAATVAENGFDSQLQADVQEINPPRYDTPPRRPAPNLPTPQNIEPGYRLPPKAEEVDPQLQADVQQINPPRYQILHPREHEYDPAPPGRPAPNLPTPQNIEPGYRLPPKREVDTP